MATGDSIQLSITFSGPMFFDFASSKSQGQVDIYVPNCPDHAAGFFVDTYSYAEVDLYEAAVASRGSGIAREYSMKSSGIPSPRQPPTVIAPVGGVPPVISTPVRQPVTNPTPARDNFGVNILSTDGSGSQKSSAPPLQADKLFFKMTLPMPKYLATLYSDLLEVVPDSGKPQGQPHFYSSSLRFFYPWDAVSPVDLYIPSGRSVSITPPIYAQLSTISDIEIRYEGPKTQDPDHSDARSCFANLAALIDKAWWLKFDDARSLKDALSALAAERLGSALSPGDAITLTSKTGSDCHAPVITTGLSLN